MKRPRKRLSRYEIISLLLSSIGLVSLVLLLYQIRIMNKQTESMLLQTQQLTDSLANTALTNISNRDLEMSKVFFDQPELLPYFFDRKNIDEKDKHYEKVYALAGMRIDLAGTFYDQSRFVPAFRDKNNPAWQAWTRYMKDIFAKSPVMCKTLEKNSSWYTNDFVEFARQGCQNSPSTKN
jgi:hypothetical protein